MIPQSDKKWVWGFAITIILVTTIPYLIGFLLQGDEWRFTGFIFGVEDGNSYIAKMLSGSVGDWLFRTPYTAYPQSGVVAFFPYILLGKLASQPGRHEQLVALFHLFRCVAIILYAFAVYDFVGYFVKELKLRRTALVLIFIGGGLGFLAIFGLKWAGFDGLPLEFYSPESFGFLAVFGLPHIAGGRAFLLWGMLIFLNSDLSQPTWKKGLKIGGFWALLGIMQPLTVVVAWAVSGAGFAAEWILSRKQKGIYQGTLTIMFADKIKTLLLAVVISAPIPVYTFISFNIDPFLKSWNQQNLILSPPPLDYLLAYGLILPFVVMGAYRAIQKRLPGGGFLVGWLLLFPFLAYAPYPLQRRLPEAIWVCIVILATLSVSMDARPFYFKRLYPVLYVGIFSTILFFAGSISTVTTIQNPMYVSIDEVKVFERVNTGGSKPFPIVLADYGLSNAIPAWAPVRTIIGHGPESKDLKILQPLVESFLDGSLNKEDAITLIKSQSVSYVIAKAGSALDLTQHYSFLVPQYSLNNYFIFSVINLPGIK